MYQRNINSLISTQEYVEYAEDVANVCNWSELVSYLTLVDEKLWWRNYVTRDVDSVLLRLFPGANWSGTAYQCCQSAAVAVDR